MSWQIPDIPEVHISERWQIKNPFYWFLILLILVLVIGLTVILLWPDNQVMHNNPKFWAFCVGLPTLIFLSLFGIQTMIQANQQEKRKAWDYQKQQIELRWKRWGQQSFDVFQSHFMLPKNLSLEDITSRSAEMVGNKVLFLDQDDFDWQQWIEEMVQAWQNHEDTIIQLPIKIFLLAEHEVDFIEKQHELMFALSQISDAPKVSIQQWTDGLATINQLIDSNKETVVLFMGWSLNDEDSDELYSEYAFWLLGGTNLRQIDHENIWCKIMRPVTIDRHEPDEIKLCIHQLYDAQVRPQSYQSLWYEGLEQKEHTLLSQAVALEDNNFAFDNQFSLTAYLGPIAQPEGLLLALACADSAEYKLLNSKVNDIWHACSMVSSTNR